MTDQNAGRMEPRKALYQATVGAESNDEEYCYTQDPPITIAEAARVLKVSPRTLANRISRHASGKSPQGPVPPYIPFGSKTRVIPRREFNEWMAKMIVGGTSGKKRGRPQKES